MAGTHSFHTQKLVLTIEGRRDRINLKNKTNMKQTLLMMLALGMCCINVSAQTKSTVRNTTPRTKTSVSSVSDESISKEKKTGIDGFVWFLVKKGKQYGAYSVEGQEIIPIKYPSVSYIVEGNDYQGHYYCHYFKVSDGIFSGVYTREGNYIIPIENHYTYVELDGVKNDNFIFWKVTKNGGKVGALDAKGKEVISPAYNHIDVQFISDERSGHSVNGSGFWFWIRSGNKSGICDLNGKLISEPKHENCLLKRTDNGFIMTAFNIIGGKSYTTEEKKVDYNNETIYNYNVYDDLYYASEISSVSVLPSTPASSSSSSSSSNNNSNNNPGSKTTTVDVEHPRDPVPVPVQEWQACFGCGGMGTMGCDNCGGSGTKYIGDRLHRCSRCNGGGIIPCNVCFGNKGQYITVYR